MLTCTSGHWSDPAALGGGLGLGVGILATPYGIAMTLERSRITAAACADVIIEWVHRSVPACRLNGRSSPSPC